MKIEFTFQLWRNYRNDIFMSYFFFLNQPVPFINFSISTHQSREFIFDLHKKLLIRKLVLNFIFLKYFLIENARSESLSIQNLYFLLIYQNKYKTLVKEKTLINWESVTNVESIKFDFRFCADIFKVDPNSQLYCSSPSYCQYWICRVSINRRKPFSPVQVWDYSRVHIVRSINTE